MCESWGLGAAAVASVRHHVGALATLTLPELPAARRPICTLSVLVNTLETAAAELDATAQLMAPQADLDPTLVLRALRQLHEQLAQAAANGRE